MKLYYKDELNRALVEDGSSSSTYITHRRIIQMSIFWVKNKAISDRSGMAFPYREMVKEWNGFVHKSEFEAKHPQLFPKDLVATHKDYKTQDQ